MHQDANHKSVCKSFVSPPKTSQDPVNLLNLTQGLSGSVKPPWQDTKAGKNPSVSIDLGARVNTSGYGEKAAKKYHFFETMFFLKRLMYDSLYDPYFSSTIQRSLKGQHHSNKPKLETIRKESQRFCERT